MATDIKTIKRLKLVRRIGLTGLAISVFVIIIILILSFLPKGNSAFTIKVDNKSDASHFVMTSDIVEPGSDPTAASIPYINAPAIKNARTTEADVVENKLNTLRASGELKKSTNISAADVLGEDKKGELALVYTMYLTNTSKTEIQEIWYQVNMDGYVEDPDSNNSPIDYLRVLISTFEIGDTSTLKNTYYANARTKEAMERYPYEDNPNDDREAVSAVDYKNIPDLEESDPRAAYYISKKTKLYEQERCDKFDDYRTGHIVSEKSVIIPAGKTLSFTFVAYFEGNDYDCRGRKPGDASLLLSLHFGA